MSIFNDLFADLTQTTETNEFGDLPQLDFDSSTFTSNATFMDPAFPTAPFVEALPVNLAAQPSGDNNQAFPTRPDSDSEEIKQ